MLGRSIINTLGVEWSHPDTPASGTHENRSITMRGKEMENGTYIFALRSRSLSSPMMPLCKVVSNDSIKSLSDCQPPITAEHR